MYKINENRTKKNKNIFPKQKLKKIVTTLLFVLKLNMNNLIRNAKTIIYGYFHLKP